jgi:hypothetical protein
MCHATGRLRLLVTEVFEYPYDTSTVNTSHLDVGARWRSASDYDILEFDPVVSEKTTWFTSIDWDHYDVTCRKVYRYSKKNHAVVD